MRFIPYRVLRNSPGEVRRRLAEEGDLIVTVDGRPFAVMTPLPEDDDGETLKLIIKLRAEMAMASMRREARKRGLDKLTEEEALDLVHKARKR